MKSKLHRIARLFVKLLGVALACYLALYIYAQEVNYTPYQVKGYEAIPNEVCAGGAIRVEVTRYADPEGNVDSIETRTSWQNQRGLSTGVTEYVSRWGEEGPDGGYGTKTVDSSILREIPQEPGEYRIVSEYVVRGSVMGVERIDRYVVSSDNTTLKVLPDSNQKCLGR